MAVTITLAELTAALRLSDSPEEQAEATRLLAYATDAVLEHVPTAPDSAHNEAVRRLAWIPVRYAGSGPGKQPTPTPCVIAGLLGCCYPTAYTGLGLCGRGRHGGNRKR